MTIPLSAHDFEDDGSGLSCLRCPLPPSHATHRTHEPPKAAPTAPVRWDAPETSHAAAAAATPRLGTFRAALLLAIAEKPDTDDALEIRLDRSHQSLSAARNGLMRDLLIEPQRDVNGEDVTRITRSGNRAIVWTVTEAGARWAQAQADVR